MSPKTIVIKVAYHEPVDSTKSTISERRDTFYVDVQDETTATVYCTVDRRPVRIDVDILYPNEPLAKVQDKKGVAPTLDESTLKPKKDLFGEYDGSNW